MSEEKEDEKFVSLLKRLDDRISFLKNLEPEDDYHESLLFSAYDELEDFKHNLLECLREVMENPLSQEQHDCLVHDLGFKKVKTRCPVCYSELFFRERLKQVFGETK